MPNPQPCDRDSRDDRRPVCVLAKVEVRQGLQLAALLDALRRNLAALAGVEAR
jgi:hypothetical protein